MAAVEEMRHLSAQVPASLVEEIEALADRHDRSKSAEVRLALKAHIDASRGEDEEAAA